MKILFKLIMVNSHFFLLSVSLLMVSTPISSSTPNDNLKKGSSLSVEKADILLSQNGKFSAGFYPVGRNAHYFGIWFNKPFCSGNCTMVWTANRDFPVNGKSSKLSLLKTGNLILTDAGQMVVWASNTISNSSVQLSLNNGGNLVLHENKGATVLWQSFDSPTDTLLPQQPLTKNTQLVSSRSQNNFSSGFYKLFFDFDNVLRLAHEGPETSSIYWPDPSFLDNEVQRSRYNDTKIAVLDNEGYFKSSDQEEFSSIDFGARYQRRLTLDFDGNLRLYSFEGNWTVTWQALSQPCLIHGSCGSNSVCLYRPGFGRNCSCLPNFKMKNQSDWAYGCEPEFKLSCKKQDQTTFVEVHSTEFYGYDFNIKKNITLEMCKKTCLELCHCKGFQYRHMAKNRKYNCYPKRELRNGYRSPNYNGTMFLKIPKSEISSIRDSLDLLPLNCSDGSIKELERSYHKKRGNGSLKILLWCAYVIGSIELISFVLVYLILKRKRPDSFDAAQGYLAVSIGFRKFTYAELKKVTNNFSHEIGRGGGGIVYKGVLPDQRITAVKRLVQAESNQGDEEFLSEVSTIGRINHKNLMDMWGFCVEGNHRLLVCEYMENGSLADAIFSRSLDCDKMFAIALGTARGLTYLHEECLEWVLRCDVKPENILLDSNYQPKVADFGLSKIRNRAATGNSNFSTIRGTRGYMAPEWVFNQHITSKVDVYSYGIVVLEMVTGRTSAMDHMSRSREETENKGLVAWVREMKNDNIATRSSWVKEIADPVLANECDAAKMEILVEVALQCVEEDKDARPSMSQAVEMLLRHEAD